MTLLRPMAQLVHFSADSNGNLRLEAEIMKKKYELPDLSVVLFADVIVTSDDVIHGDEPDD